MKRSLNFLIKQTSCITVSSSLVFSSLLLNLDQKYDSKASHCMRVLLSNFPKPNQHVVMLKLQKPFILANHWAGIIWRICTACFPRQRCPHLNYIFEILPVKSDPLIISGMSSKDVVTRPSAKWEAWTKTCQVVWFCYWWLQCDHCNHQ